MSTSSITTIENLGYNEFFETGRKNLGFSDYSIARVTAEHREAYNVRNVDGEYFAKISGKHMFTAVNRDDYPAVGDWVAITILPQNKAIIRGILPRISILKKKYSNKQASQIIATNIDIAFITESMDRDYNLNRLERFLVLAEESKIKPVVILNKVDLISEDDLNFRIKQITDRFNSTDIISTSIVTKQGLTNLEKYIIRGKTYCFLGSSGVGKSSLINKLLGQDEIKTGKISESIQRGRHTTTTREMYFLENGGILIDNPGTREVGIAGSDKGLENVFDEISLLSRNCRYSDCSHTNEPGCAVLKAVMQKTLDEDKYSNYIKLKKESEFYKLTELEKREKDRKFGKFVKKALQELKS
jgi:ribosome biogenesis GTPase / thiamine phosphate phosphatase